MLPRGLGHPAHPFLGLRGPCASSALCAQRRLLLRWPGQGLPQPTCHPTPRKRAAPSWLLFVPPPSSALGRRLLPRRPVEVLGTALGPPGRASGTVHPARSKPGPFLPRFSRVESARSWGRRCAQPGASAGECPGRGRAEPVPREQEKVEAGAPGRAVLEPELRRGCWAGGRCLVGLALAFGGDAAVRASRLSRVFRRRRPRGSRVPGPPSLGEVCRSLCAATSARGGRTV